MNIAARSTNFVKEVRSELTKVSWSTRQEVLGSTFVVIVITAMLAVFIFIVDVVLSRFLNIMFR